MGHFELMKLPWPILISYIASINEIAELQSEHESYNNYFNGSAKLADIWQRNKGRWAVN